MTWRVELEDKEDCKNLVQIAEEFERVTRMEKADRTRAVLQQHFGAVFCFEK